MMKPLQIGLNLLFLVPDETGGLEVYTRELLPHLARADADIHFTAFINKETERRDGPWRDLASVVVPVHSRRRAEWVFGEQALLPGLARRHGVRILHSLGSTAPAYGRFARVVTIHDLNYVHVPEAHFGLRALGVRALVPLAARTSDRIIAPSEATARDVTAHLKVNRTRIDVVPYGLGAAGTHPSDLGDIRRRLGIDGRRVLLSVSAKRPHKNLLRLLEAFAMVHAEPRPVLILPGYPTPHEDELRVRADALGIRSDVRFLGWVPAADLEALYAIADAFIFPSLHEGGGLPVLEAMARAVPVACSDQSAIPEFAGDAALLFDPTSTEAITGAINRLLNDHGLANRLRNVGPARAARFTWEATAEGTIASYRSAATSAFA